MSAAQLESWLVKALGRPAPGAGARLLARIADARASLDGIALDDGEICRQLAARVDEGEDAAAALDELHVTDVALAFACAAGDDAAIARFERDYMAQLPRMIARIDRTPDFAREVAQGLRERLLVGGGGLGPRIASYSGRAPLGAWFRVVATNAALQLKRPPMESPRRRRDLAEQALAAGDNPERELLRGQHREVFQQALEDSLAALAARDRNLLRAYYVDGFTVDQLAARFRIHRATAARRVQAVRERLLSEARVRVTRQLGISEDEFASLARLLQSQLRLSLSLLG